MDALGKTKALVQRLCDARDRRAAWGFASLLLVAEAVLCAAIIWRVPCKSANAITCCAEFNAQDAIGPQYLNHADTEIDWVAYMQEVEGFLDVSLHNSMCLIQPGMASGAQCRQILLKPATTVLKMAAGPA